MKSMLAITLSCLLFVTAAQAAGERTLSADRPAAGVERVTVHGGQGEMRITPSTDGMVHVKLVLQQQEKSFLWLFNWLSGETTHDLAGAALKLDQSPDGLAVSLKYPSNDAHSDVQEKWTISLPAKSVLSAEMRAGMIQIKGMQAGIKAHLRAGELEISSPAGGIQAAVDYGRLKVSSDTDAPGVLTLSSDHGLAVLSLDGKYYGPPEDHGFMGNVHLLGNAVTEHAPGKDNMDLSVYAGAVSLRVGPLKDDEKTYRALFTD